MLKRYPFFACSLLFFVCCAGLAQAAGDKKADGFKFPPIKVPSLQYVAGKAKTAPKIFEFSEYLGKQAIALFYFLPQHKASLTELKAFAMAAQIFAGKVKFVTVTKASDEKEATTAYNKLKELGITLPLLLDAKGLMAYVMLTRRVPSYALITKKGMLRLAKAGGLSEKVSPTDTLLGMITRMSRGEEIPFTRAPGFSPNPYNLIGNKAPLFQLAKALKADGTFLGNPKAGDVYSLKQSLAKRKPVLLVFWSVTCPHCQQMMPVLSKYAQTRKQDFETVSMVIAHDKKLQDALQELQKKHKFQIPILNSPKGAEFGAYYIMTVPTMYLIRPNGKVHTVYMGGGAKIGATIDAIYKDYKEFEAKQTKRPAPPAKRTTKPAKRQPAARQPAARQPAARQPAARQPAKPTSASAPSSRPVRRAPAQR